MAKPMRVLSIDGGGIRGLIPAAMLTEVERIIRERTTPDAQLCDYFDLFAGTSTGGLIVGLMLLPEGTHGTNGGCGGPRSATEVVEFYQRHAETLFERSPLDRIRRVGGLFDERYGTKGMNRALDTALGLRGLPGPEPMVSQLIKPTVITTYNATTDSPYFFKQHRAIAADGRDFTIRDMALATAAAPTYFEPVQVSSTKGPLGVCVDGGLAANNPAMCAFAEATNFFGRSAADIAILSLGTGVSTHSFSFDELKDRGLLRWAEPIIDMMMAGSDRVVDYQLRQIFGSGEVHGEGQYLRLQADLSGEDPSVAELDNPDPANVQRLIEIGQTLARKHEPAIAQFVESQLLGDNAVIPRSARTSSPLGSIADVYPARTASDVETPSGHAQPSEADKRKIARLIKMRKSHFRTVNQGTIDRFRRRHMPTSSMPHLVPACTQYPSMHWAPKELMVPTTIPDESSVPATYMAKYYGLGKFGFGRYTRNPVSPDVVWDPSFEWNTAFPSTGDGWEHPTSDDTFARLRLQGPNPWLLRRIDDETGPDGEREPTFELDFTDLFEGILPPVTAWFAVRDGKFIATKIAVTGIAHSPGDPTWDQAKRTVNAADARFVVLGLHLLGTHWIVGQAFSLATYTLPTWHPLRPFMHFFTYGTLTINHTAYKALVTPSSYFIQSGFVTTEDAQHLFRNVVDSFDLDRWIAPRDIADRGIDAIPDHPWVDDALPAWAEFTGVVERHLDELELTDETIAKDADLQSWYLTLGKTMPNTDTRKRPLDRQRLVELCTALMWNNVVHEVCGDMSPILGSTDPADKSIINLAKFKQAVGDGQLTSPVAPPTMADVFLLDQASFVSRFNVGGNNLLTINPWRMVDDPKLQVALHELQTSLRTLQDDLVETNKDRPVRFARMFPGNWEASISF